jgi:hypothetical protein
MALHLRSMLPVWINERFLSTSRIMKESQCIQDDLLTRLGTCGLTDVVELTVVAPEDHGDPILSLELEPNAFPAKVDALRFEMKA